MGTIVLRQFFDNWLSLKRSVLFIVSAALNAT